MRHISASQAFGLDEKNAERSRWRVASRLYQPTWPWSVVTQQPYQVRSPEKMFDFYGSSFIRLADFQCHGYTNDKNVLKGTQQSRFG